MDSSSLASSLIGLIFSAIWIVRLRYERREMVMDLAWFFGLSAYVGDEWFLCDGRSLNPWLVWVPQYLSIFLTLFNPQWFSKTTIPDATDSEGARGSSMNFDPQQNQLRPLVFPCRTSHTRMSPKSHSFSYSYLFVGVPVGWRGTMGKLLSADMKSLPWKGRSPRSWLSVESADHLERGDHIHGLRGKLESYLKIQVRGGPSQRAEILLLKYIRKRTPRITRLPIWSLHLGALATLSTQCLSGISTTTQASTSRP